MTEINQATYHITTGGGYIAMYIILTILVLFMFLICFVGISEIKENSKKKNRVIISILSLILGVFVPLFFSFTAWRVVEGLYWGARESEIYSSYTRDYLSPYGSIEDKNSFLCPTKVRDNLDKNDNVIVCYHYNDTDNFVLVYKNDDNTYHISTWIVPSQEKELEK